jgi:hypothetical protein
VGSGFSRIQAGEAAFLTLRDRYSTMLVAVKPL